MRATELFSAVELQLTSTGKWRSVAHVVMSSAGHSFNRSVCEGIIDNVAGVQLQCPMHIAGGVGRYQRYYKKNDT